MHDLTPFADRREQTRAVGCTAIMSLLLELVPPLDIDPGPVPVSPVCRLCGNVAVLYVSLFQWYRDPAGRELGEDVDLGLGVCAPCAETHAPGLLAAQRAKTLERDAARRGDSRALALFTAAHDRVRATVPPLLRALGLDAETTAEASAMADPYDS